MISSPTPTSRRYGLWLAFIGIYLIWGSTYLAIRFAVETMPPFLMAGARFLSAGLVLYPLVRLQGAPAPRNEHWRSAMILGCLMLLGGNGLVSWAEQWLPSGITALIIGSTPLWFNVLDWLFFAGPRPTGRRLAGIVLGFAGIYLLVRPENLSDGSFNPLAVAAVLIGCVSFAFGSLYSRSLEHPPSLFLTSAMQMIAGGAAMVILGSLKGEWQLADPALFSTRSILAMAYLIVIGSLLGFSAYVYLLRHAAPAAVSTYAYVNPVVAVFLGYALANETLGASALLAAAMVVVSVILITAPDHLLAKLGLVRAATATDEATKN
ncbi:MAG: drug/metabolite exporter YedA [Phycisphaeraceae bacterium]|nr:drug/metabolite exporter YedA [Phycisphaeraceae bacterium]